jgi:hypothetical protein
MTFRGQQCQNFARDTYRDKETIPVLALTFHSFWARSGLKVREASQNVARLHLHVSGLYLLKLPCQSEGVRITASKT